MGNYCCREDSSPNTITRLFKRPLSSSPTDPTQKHEGFGLDETGPNQLISLASIGRPFCWSPSCPQIHNLEVIGKLGKGGQGEVFEVSIASSQKNTKASQMIERESPFALKRVSKQKNLQHSSSLKLGSSLLVSNECPFILDGLMCLEDDDYFYELMEVAEGGDLSTFLSAATGKRDQLRKLGEAGIRLILAGVVIGLEYLHNNSYIYGDLKINNVLIGKDGYPKLSDLDLISQGSQIGVQKIQGAVFSTAPQILTQDKVDKGIDLWALGILIYTLAFQELPYEQQDILFGDFIEECSRREGKYGLKRIKVSEELKNLINALLKCDPKKRLGYQSIAEIKNHPFFTPLDWQKYQSKELQNPIKDIVHRFSKPKRGVRHRKTSLELKNISLGSSLQKSTASMSERKTKCDLKTKGSSDMENE